VAGRIGALVAAVLVIPGLALAPAHAALSSAAILPSSSTPIVTPQIEGMGSISSAVLNCVSTTASGTLCSDSATFGELGGALSTVTNALSMTAAPAPGWEFEGWSGGGCSGTSPTCTLSAAQLTAALTGALAGTPLAPIASFIPADGSGDPLPGTCEIGIADCTPPVTKLNAKPTVKPTSRASDGAGVTQAPSATFTFQAFEPVEDSNPPAASTTPTEGATFECKLRKLPATTPDFAACPGTTSGTASYTALTDGTYEFAVRAVDADGNEDATPETFTWTVDTTAPVTELNTRTKFWVLTRKASFGLDVAPPDVASDMSFQCYLDGAGRQCPTVVFSSGTHTFGAAATDKAGNADETPVTHTFTMPVNNKALGHSKGWTKAKVKGTFLNTASITKKKGAKVATKATGITRIALVASKGKGHGTVKVMLGKKTLKKVSLAHKRNVKKKVVPIAKFSTPVNGKVTVQVVTQGKKVVIEGLGIATR
jgi:hypothetical protein